MTENNSVSPSHDRWENLDSTTFRHHLISAQAMRSLSNKPLMVVWVLVGTVSICDVATAAGDTASDGTVIGETVWHVNPPVSTGHLDWCLAPVACRFNAASPPLVTLTTFLQ